LLFSNPHLCGLDELCVDEVFGTLLSAKDLHAPVFLASYNKISIWISVSSIFALKLIYSKVV